MTLWCQNMYELALNMICVTFFFVFFKLVSFVGEYIELSKHICTTDRVWQHFLYNNLLSGRLTQHLLSNLGSVGTEQGNYKIAEEQCSLQDMALLLILHYCQEHNLCPSIVEALLQVVTTVRMTLH
jgi:hypothetical protein